MGTPLNIKEPQPIQAYLPAWPASLPPPLSQPVPPASWEEGVITPTLGWMRSQVRPGSCPALGSCQAQEAALERAGKAGGSGAPTSQCWGQSPMHTGLAKCQRLLWAPRNQTRTSAGE